MLVRSEHRKNHRRTVRGPFTPSGSWRAGAVSPFSPNSNGAGARSCVRRRQLPTPQSCIALQNSTRIAMRKLLTLFFALAVTHIQLSATLASPLDIVLGFPPGVFQSRAAIDAPPAAGGSCTGGTRTTSGGNTIIAFMSSGTLNCTASFSAQILVVGGGGAGGGGSGGGGAGG